MREWSPEVSQSEPKGVYKERVGAKRLPKEPKGAQREPKKSQRDPKGNQKGTKIDFLNQNGTKKHAKLEPSWGYVGPCWRHVGSRGGHLIQHEAKVGKVRPKMLQLSAKITDFVAIFLSPIYKNCAGSIVVLLFFV